MACRRKSQPSKFQKVKAYTSDFESCFKIVIKKRSTKMRTFAKDAGELLKSTDVLESHFIMSVLSQVIVEHLNTFDFPVNVF